MIRFLVDFALQNRMLVLALGVALLIWGIISFHNLPVEAYPDVADKYVWVITQWPGRAAEEVEQQVTIPIETQMNGVGHLTHLRSTSLAGLSFITIHLRRRIRQSAEPPAGAGKADAGESAAGIESADRPRLQSGRANLLLHAAKHQSASTTSWT